MLAGSSGVVENCSSVTNACNVQLIAGRFTPSFDLSNDLAVFDACVLHRHDQLLMPVDLSAAGIVGNNSECAFISPFEFAQNILERQEVSSAFRIPIRRSYVQFTRKIDLLVSSVVAIFKLTLANLAFGYPDRPALILRELRGLLGRVSQKTQR